MAGSHVCHVACHLLDVYDPSMSRGCVPEMRHVAMAKVASLPRLSDQSIENSNLPTIKVHHTGTGNTPSSGHAERTRPTARSELVYCFNKPLIICRHNPNVNFEGPIQRGSSRAHVCDYSISFMSEMQRQWF